MNLTFTREALQQTISTDLCPRFNEFQKIGPWLVDLIFPLRYRSSVSVTCSNQLITDSIRGSHALGTSVRSITRELAEFLDKQLLRDNKGKKRISYENFHDKSYKIKLWTWSWFYEYGQKDIWKIKWHKQKQKIKADTFEALYLKKKNYCRLHSTEFLQNKWDSKWHGADYVFTVSNR